MKQWIVVERPEYVYTSPIALEPEEPESAVVLAEDAVEAFRRSPFYDGEDADAQYYDITCLDDEDQ